LHPCFLKVTAFLSKAVTFYGKNNYESGIRAIVVTVSDSRIEADDVSGAKLLELLESIGADVSGKNHCVG